MLRLGTAGPWLLLLCGLACSDRVVVARGLSLVSAAASSGDDAGLGELEPEDAGQEAADAGSKKPFDFAHGMPSPRPPSPSSPPAAAAPSRNVGHGDARDQGEEKEPEKAGEKADEKAGDKADESDAERDAGHRSEIEHH